MGASTHRLARQRTGSGDASETLELRDERLGQHGGLILFAEVVGHEASDALCEWHARRLLVLDVPTEGEGDDPLVVVDGGAGTPIETLLLI